VWFDLLLPELLIAAMAGVAELRPHPAEGLLLQVLTGRNALGAVFRGNDVFPPTCLWL